MTAILDAPAREHQAYHSTTIARLETGAQEVRIPDLIAISEATGVSLRKFLEPGVNFPTVLRQARSKAGLSQKALADLIDANGGVRPLPELAAKISRLRTDTEHSDTHISQKTLAQYMQAGGASTVHPTTIVRIEQGLRDVRLSELHLIAAVFGLTASSLLTAALREGPL